MSLLLGFNTKRIFSILIGLFGLAVYKFMDSEYVAYISNGILAVSLTIIISILIIVLLEYANYIQHYRRYTKLRNDWNEKALMEYKHFLSQHYQNYLSKEVHYYILYRHMIEDIDSFLEKQ